MSVVAGWILAVGLIVWIGAVLWAAGVPKGLRPWLKHPKNAAKAIRVGIWIVALGLASAAWLSWFDDPLSELGGWRKEFSVIALTILGIEEASRLRARQEYKQSVVQQMASLSNDFALDAARIASNEGWLRDGSLQGVDLWMANLQGADMWDANLRGGDLRMANLQGARLLAANLQGVDLRVANLQGANLSGANLQGTNLSGANLQGADLSGAYLQDAHLWGANLSDARYTKYTIWPDDFTPPADAIHLDISLKRVSHSSRR